ncbi:MULTISPECIES: PIG-L family deacetylase [Acidobacteriaceae]|uniref:PIG-L family deacetylase n=1 Tax=Acidobacteriaceae TaxID=204434 RepID=UPI00131BB922|nr:MULTISPECIES: PIG-L family deacetylase [Acidobacteriaceae]MDW5264657.1 PIG-L family deacetylase [Edaphobacter sp.]
MAKPVNIDSKTDLGRKAFSIGQRTLPLTMSFIFLLSALTYAQPPGKTLIVVAHPDDEYYFAATVYRMAVQLKGTVDELVITNGEGGFHYSTLAEPFYGETLTTEESGRRELPAIRREETLRAGKILGIRDHFFLEQKDQAFTTDRDSGLKHLWDSTYIQQTIADLIRGQHYQYVFTILPRSTTHGHHQAATALAERAVESLPVDLRPVVLGFDTDSSEYVPAAGFVEAKGWEPGYAFAFDRNTHFGFHDALTFQVIVSWMITEHKSQGLLQTMHNKDAKEFIWVHLDDSPLTLSATSLLFQHLAPG